MRSILLAVLTSALLVGCTAPTSPEDAPARYAQLVQLASVEARAREDSTFLWLRNTENAEARRLMLGLGLDFVRYDAVDGVVCAWSGGGMLSARGYVTRLPESRPPADRLGETCMRAGSCTETSLTDDWTAFRCN